MNKNNYELLYDSKTINKLLVPVAYSEENEYIICSDGYVGFSFIGRGFCYALLDKPEYVAQYLNQNFPAGSFVQIMLIASEKVIGDDKALNIELLITAKIPYSGVVVSDKDKSKLVSLKESSEAIFKESGLNLEPLSARRLKKLYDEFLFSDSERGEYDDRTLLNEQVLNENEYIGSNNFGVAISKDGVERYGRTLSVNRFPEHQNITAAAYYIADARNGLSGIKGPCSIAINIFYPSPEDVATLGSSSKKKSGLISLDHAPPLLKQKADYKSIFAEIDDIGRSVMCYMGVCFFDENEKAVDDRVLRIKEYYNDLGFHLMEDHYYALPLFINNLPLNSDVNTLSTSRYKTLSTESIANIVPIISDWAGNVDDGIKLISRIGQVVNYDFGYGNSDQTNAFVTTGKFGMEGLSGFVKGGGNIYMDDRVEQNIPFSGLLLESCFSSGWVKKLCMLMTPEDKSEYVGKLIGQVEDIDSDSSNLLADPIIATARDMSPLYSFLRLINGHEIARLVSGEVVKNISCAIILAVDSLNRHEKVRLFVPGFLLDLVKVLFEVVKVDIANRISLIAVYDSVREILDMDVRVGCLLLTQQKADSINELRKSGILEVPPYYFDYIKTVSMTSEYTEALIYERGLGSGVGKFYRGGRKHES